MVSEPALSLSKGTIKRGHFLLLNSQGSYLNPPLNGFDELTMTTLRSHKAGIKEGCHDE